MRMLSTAIFNNIAALATQVIYMAGISDALGLASIITVVLSVLDLVDRRIIAIEDSESSFTSAQMQRRAVISLRTALKLLLSTTNRTAMDGVSACLPKLFSFIWVEFYFKDGENMCIPSQSCDLLNLSER